MGKKERFFADIMAMHPEVTGSCNLVNVRFPDGHELHFVVDCGLFQEKDYSKYNKQLNFDPRNIDFCLVTHNHVDHIGRLPLLTRNGYTGKIYTSCVNQKLMPIALADCAKVIRENAKRTCDKAIFNDDDVDDVMAKVEGIPYAETKQIHRNVKVTFFANGHLVGAALILVQISYNGYEDINLLFTGDYNCRNEFVEVEPLPEWVTSLPMTVIQEATYGDMDSTEISKSFERNACSCLEKDGTVVALVFSLGRSQEILYELKRMQESGVLSTEIPIYLDGKLAIKYTKMYLKTDLNLKSGMQDFLPENLAFVDKSSRASVLHSPDKKVIVTTAGMGSYGPAQAYIPEYISRKKALIQFTGYVAEGTLGRRLKETQKNTTVEIGGVLRFKNADVEYTTEYSAHAKADEMIAFLQQFSDLKLVLVNHGETKTKDIFGDRILKEVQVKAIGILGRDYFFRVNPYGLVSTKPTKFM